MQLHLTLTRLIARATEAQNELQPRLSQEHAAAPAADVPQGQEEEPWSALNSGR